MENNPTKTNATQTDASPDGAQAAIKKPDHKKRNILIIAAVVVVLAAAITLLAILNAPKDAVQVGTVTVVKDGQTLRTFTMEEIQALPYVEVEKEISSASFANESGLFRGTPMRTLLEAADANWQIGAVQVVARAQDAFVGAFSAEEVAMDDNVLVVYAKDGESLGTMEQGGSGPLRVIAQRDPYGNRSTRYLYQLEVTG